MEDKNKKRDPMPPPDATPEEIGEFWDTHSLADYWDETHEVEFQVNLKSRQDPSPDKNEAVDQNDPLSAEQGWRKLKELIQSLDKLHEERKNGEPFEELAAELLGALLDNRFKIEQSGYQPIGDAINEERTIVLQTKNYSDETPLDRKVILGDIQEADLELPNLQTYVLAASRTINSRLRNRLGEIEDKTGLDIVVLELSDKLSDLGALCVTFWENIHHLFDPSDIDQQFWAWVEITRNDLKTQEKMKVIQNKLDGGIQTQKHVQKDIQEYLLERFSRDEGFNPINLSEAIDRKSLESKISDWWNTPDAPICCLEGEEGHGKTWLAAKSVHAICESENIVAFWLDSKYWKDCKSIFDLLYTCFDPIYLSDKQEKITKLRNKAAKTWRKTLIILDGVNERNAIEAAQRILAEYFKNDEDKNKWADKVRFLLTTRPLDNYPDFESYLWSGCHKISVDPFDDSELQDALARKGLQLGDLPDALKKEVARIPRYFQTCIRLRNQFRSFDDVTKVMVLWADLLDKIERTDPQIKQKIGWHRAKDAQEILSDLAKQANWTNVDADPQVSVQLLEKYFPNYREVRHDLEERRITIEAGLLEVKLNKDHIILGWALYLANLFDCTEFTEIKDAAEGLQNALEPIPSEDLRTEALFVALQISDISPPDISQDELSQKRAALMLAWFHSHNARITDERLSFWAEKDPDAYAQVVRVQLETHNSATYEKSLIGPLAHVWLHQTGQIDQLRLRLTEWFLVTSPDDDPEDIVYVGHKEDQFAREKSDIQTQLSRAAISILSQRPDPRLLEPLARCYGILQGNAESDRGWFRFSRFNEDLGKLMRWGYTEAFLEDLRLLEEQPQADQLLLKGVDRLKTHLQGVNSPRLNTVIDRIRNHEQILTGESSEVNANRGYHGLDYLAVRTDLDGLCDEDQDEIKKILDYISVNPKKRLSENLIPWVAKYELESYSKFACDSKINALNPEYPPYVLRATQGLIFQQNDRERITKAILEVKQDLTQGDDPSLGRANLLTEILLFSAPEDILTDWFEFLASHAPLREVICYKPLRYLLEQLLPKPIVKLARQKLEELRSSVVDNSPPSNGESKEFPEEEFWCMLYAYAVPINEETIKYALEELKMREPDSTGTYPMLRLALSDPKQFLDEMLVDDKIKEHLSSKDGRQFIVRPYDKDEDIPPYEVLRSFLPPEIIGSFLCKQDRQDDLSRWGKELIRWLCSILQGNDRDFDYNSEMRFLVDTKVIRTWAEQNTSDFEQLTDEYLTQLSKSLQYDQVLSHFTDDICCLLLRFQPDKAKQYYHQWNADSFKTVYRTSYGVPTLLAQLWKVEDCNSLEHCELRRELLEECLNDEDIMFMTLAALVEGGRDELWSLVEGQYLESPYAKERNLGVSILPWLGTDEAIEELERLKSDDTSLWVREHAAWAYEVSQQERSCREVYREALQTRDLFRISAVFEQIKPALSPTARWWHREIEKEEFGDEPQDTDPKLVALVDRFWYRWGNSQKTKRNIEVFGRKLRSYCRGEKFSGTSTPRLAPWWKPSSD